jgi:3-hydroxyisobutyrate dehydrogenase-like beta-hydroxyacid dehydrogenase
MSKVAFLGLGAMGSRMAANLLKAGHQLTVWNLTPEAANKLAASGAKAAARNVFRRAIDEKLGDLNMTAVVKLFDYPTLTTI